MVRLGRGAGVSSYVKNVVAQGNVEDGVFLGWEDLAYFVLPAIPRAVAPEIIYVEKTTLKQIVPKAYHFFFTETGRAHVGHEDEWKVLQPGVGEP